MAAQDPAKDVAIDEARALLRATDIATLGTLRREDGGPNVSLVLLAVDHDLSPILLISSLAEHTKNIAADPRVSLLIDGTPGLESRLAGTRLTLHGVAARASEPRHRDRFLARHPEAAGYADFADFAFYRLAVSGAHLVAGFGRIDSLPAEALSSPGALDMPLVAVETDIVAHMNEDHGDAVDLCAVKLLGREGGGWVMTGCDSAGCDLRRGGEVARLVFAPEVADAEGARRQLVRLTRRAQESAHPWDGARDA